jgi:hypothetical protein
MRRLLLVLVGLAAPASMLQADVILNVTMDTQPLISGVAGPFSLAFELSPGSSTFNNTALFNAFNFGSGSPDGTPTLVGGASGDLSDSVLVSDTGTVNFFAQGFLAGNTLTFTIDLETNTQAGGIPDELTVYILDSTDTPIPTAAGFGSDYLMSMNADSNNLNVQTFGGDTSRGPVGGGPPIDFAAPVVTFAPEPQSVALTGVVGFPLLALWFIVSRRRVSKS